MGYVSTWQNAKTLGRPNDEEATEQKDVEMASIPNTSEEKKETIESKTVEGINNDNMTKTAVAPVTPVTPDTPVAPVTTVTSVDVNVQE